MAGLAWTPDGNGTIQLNKLHIVPNFSPLDSGFSNAQLGSNLMREDAARQLSGLMQAFWKRFKRRLLLSEGYRPLAIQDKYWDRYQRKLPGWTIAALPKTSIHGWGLSADLAVEGVGNPSGEYLAWLRANAGKYGFVNDVSKETWHWSYRTDMVTKSITVNVYISNPQADEAQPQQPAPEKNINLEDDMPRLIRVNEPNNPINGLVAFLFPMRVVRTGDNKIPGVKGSDQIYRLGRAWGLIPPNAKWEDHVENMSAIEFITAENDINDARNLMRREIATEILGTYIDVPSFNGKQTLAARVGGSDQNIATIKDLISKLDRGDVDVDVDALASKLVDAMGPELSKSTIDLMATRLQP